MFRFFVPRPFATIVRPFCGHSHDAVCSFSVRFFTLLRCGRGAAMVRPKQSKSKQSSKAKQQTRAAKQSNNAGRPAQWGAGRPAQWGAGRPAQWGRGTSRAKQSKSNKAAKQSSKAKQQTRAAKQSNNAGRPAQLGHGTSRAMGCDLHVFHDLSSSDLLVLIFRRNGGRDHLRPFSQEIAHVDPTPR